MTCCCGVVAGVARKPDLGNQGGGLSSSTITDLVRNAGGNTTALFRVSMAWDSWSDVDLHINEPNNGEHIYFSHRTSLNTGGTLDVDMNVSSNPHPQNTNKHSKPAVENIMYNDLSKMPDGVYDITFVQYGEWIGRSAGADRPYILIEHRVPEEQPMSHYVLLKQDGENAVVNTREQIPLVKVRKTGTQFKLLKVESNVRILEVHNFDTGHYTANGGRTNNNTENAATSGNNPTGRS